jgi:hypothetical protein
MKPAMKIGLLGTVDPQGRPHVTLLTSLMASSPAALAFGQFTEGRSKKFIYENPKAGFLVMSLNKHLWRGKARFSHTARGGVDFEYYNSVPMFHYNAYFGIHTVYYFDLVAHTGEQTLPMNRIVYAAIQTMVARRLGRSTGGRTVLNPWTRLLLDRLDNLKFLACVGEDGYPILIPAIQAQSLDAQRILFSTSVYADELAAIPTGTGMALFGMTLAMEDVLVGGTYTGVRRIGGVRAGVLEVERVYNPMPPASGQIYPPVEVKAITEF